MNPYLPEAKITYNFGQRRTVTKKDTSEGHLRFIYSLSDEDLAVVELQFWHEPAWWEIELKKTLEIIIDELSQDSSEYGNSEPQLCGGCGEMEENCICSECFGSDSPSPLPSAEYFRNITRERVLSDLNATFAEMVRDGNNQITDQFYPWVISHLRQNGFDVEECKVCICDEDENLLPGKVFATVFLTGRF